MMSVSPMIWTVRTAQHQFSMCRPEPLSGIIGKTGAGKTTLVNLLTRFYDPTEGAIFLDGKDLKDISVRGFAKTVFHRSPGAGSFSHDYCRKHRLRYARRRS